jgi:endonuclease YncB( thermonuclease family)
MWRCSAQCANVGFFCVAVLCVSQAQDVPKPQPKVIVDFSNDPCGNPLMESNTWIRLEGTLWQIVDGRTLIVLASDPKRTVEVRLAGITLERGPAATKAHERLHELLKQPVELMMSQSDFEKKPRKITAVAHARNRDVALDLLTGGLARFAEPPPYTASYVTLCHYRKAEEEARAKGVGLWQKSEFGGSVCESNTPEMA